MNKESPQNNHLKLLESADFTEAEADDTLCPSEAELNEICDTHIDPNELEAKVKVLKLPRRQGGIKIEALRALCETDYDKIIPHKAKTAPYNHFAEACKALLPSAQKALELMEQMEKEGLNEAEKKQFEPLVVDVAKLMLLQKKAWAFLSERYYPQRYEKVINAAKAEVMQFLIKQANIQALDEFKLTSEAEVTLMNRGQFAQRYGGYVGITHLASNPPAVANALSPHTFEENGDMSGISRVNVNMGSEEIKSEWDLFHVLVHELVHCVSVRVYGDAGIRSKISAEINDYRLLNECITEMVTCIILEAHLEKNKTALKGQGPLKESEVSYSDYIKEVKKMLERVPLHFFVDAMLNREGMAKLEAKFAKVFDDPKALNKFAKELNRVDPKRTQRVQYLA